jgi:hypothetical protein
MGFGTADLGDEALRSHINRASLAVDRFCNVPMVPARYTFRGGTMVDEDHDFSLGDGVSVPQQRIFWPYAKPIKSVQSLRIYVTNSQYVDFEASELFVRKDSIEVVSLTMTSVGLFGQYTLPIIGLTTPTARMSYTYGYSFTATEEFVEPTDGRLYRAQNQFWDDTDVVVKVNGAVVTTGFTIDRTEGTVQFTTNQPADTVVSVSYGYPLPNEVAQATGITVARYIGDSELIAKGMSGVQSLRVGEISIERPSPRATSNTMSVDLPNEAKQLLDGLQFITAR